MVDPSGEDRRIKRRVDFTTRITLRIKDAELKIDGSSKDISLNGVFIHTDEALPLNEPCDVEIILTGTVEPLNLKMNGKIARKEAHGVAVAFGAMDIDSYSHLKNIVRYNTSDPDDVH
jgi:hypothetical protein